MRSCARGGLRAGPDRTGFRPCRCNLRRSRGPCFQLLNGSRAGSLQPGLVNESWAYVQSGTPKFKCEFTRVIFNLAAAQRSVTQKTGNEVAALGIILSELPRRRAAVLSPWCPRHAALAILPLPQYCAITGR